MREAYRLILFQVFVFDYISKLCLLLDPDVDWGTEGNECFLRNLRSRRLWVEFTVL